MCSAGSRLLVHESIKESLLQRIEYHAQEFRPADPLLNETRLGAIVDNTQLQKVTAFIKSGCDQGAKLRLGGKQVLQSTGGFYLEPTLFDSVQPHMDISRNEIFGPVLSVFSFKDEAEAIRTANDTIYGLAAAVWTRDINVAHRISRAIRAGMVYINCYHDDDITVPFGGFKESGIGRDKSLHALDKYTELKTTWIKISEN